MEDAESNVIRGEGGRVQVVQAIRQWEQLSAHPDDERSIEGSLGERSSPDRLSLRRESTPGRPSLSCSLDEVRTMVEKLMAEQYVLLEQHVQKIKGEILTHEIAALEQRLGKVADDVACERSSREGVFFSLSERLECVAAQVDRAAQEAQGPMALATAMLHMQGQEPSHSNSPFKNPDASRLERLVEERLKAAHAAQMACVREQETSLRAVSNELTSVAEGHRLQVLKVTQAVSDLGRELSFRLDKLETDCRNQTQKVTELEDGKLASTARQFEELADTVRTQGAAFGRQEAMLAILRDDLKHEQRVRKDEIHVKLREVLARPLRPEEEAVSELRQAVAGVRDDCSRLRAECRRLSSDVTSVMHRAYDSDPLAAVQQQLGAMRNLLDGRGGDEDIQISERPQAAVLPTADGAPRACSRPTTSRSENNRSPSRLSARGATAGRQSPAREKPTQAAGASRNVPGATAARPSGVRGAGAGRSPGRVRQPSKLAGSASRADLPQASWYPSSPERAGELVAAPSASSRSASLRADVSADASAGGKMSISGMETMPLLALPPQLELQEGAGSGPNGVQTPTDPMAGQLHESFVQAQLPDSQSGVAVGQHASTSSSPTVLGVSPSSAATISPCSAPNWTTLPAPSAACRPSLVQAPVAACAHTVMQAPAACMGVGSLQAELPRSASGSYLMRPVPDARLQAAVAAVAAVHTSHGPA